MASSPINEKAPVVGLTLSTSTASPTLANKASQDTLGSGGLSPSAEKADGRPRPSDVSTPSTAHLNPFDTDIEAIITTTETNHRRSLECTKGGTDCHVWPSQEHWKAKAKKAKQQRRNCNCLGGLSKRNRIIAKALIGLLVVGIAVGVGFGVSKPLGASIWHS
ncbi:hypothetical protein GQ53DRAFT_759792 [Thozetella sp. PMI_491]|nr:hypothetical protein GQ53DRAFT_759792 [Thozetella sp. PMI_491]